MLVHMFNSQVELNRTVAKVSALLDVPRFALNIDAASRGVLAGCVTLALSGSPFRIDCRHVGSVSRSYPSFCAVCNLNSVIIDRGNPTADLDDKHNDVNVSP